MRRILLAPMVAFFFPALAAAQSGATANQLTAKERKEGWELLFDGKSTDKWRGYQRKDMTGLRWTASGTDGCLEIPPKEGQDTHGERDIVTRKQYDDFELVFDWRIPAGANSGVKYLVSEDRPAAIGHEYQLIDDDKHPDAKKENRRTGSFYDVLAAPTAKRRPIGEFNQSRIVVKGNHVEHWLNGAKILSYELDSEPVRKAIAGSKFKNVEGFDKHKQGFILLQDHGDAICFRNLKIRETKPGQ
jgi:Domain of Unknown Function (DUF1080)